MTNQHPITPPPELVQQWTQIQAAEQAVTDHWQHIATQAARWGADQELEACAEWLRAAAPAWERQLHTARRPKPPSLKEQALGALGRFSSNAHTRADEMTKDFDLLRRALEALDD